LVIWKSRKNSCTSYVILGSKKKKTIFFLIGNYLYPGHAYAAKPVWVKFFQVFVLLTIDQIYIRGEVVKVLAILTTRNKDVCYSFFVLY